MTYGAQAFHEAHKEHGNVAKVRGNRRQDGKNHVDNHGHPECPFRGENFGHSTAGHLRYDVSPKIGAQNKTLDRLRPDKRSVLASREFKNNDNAKFTSS